MTLRPTSTDRRLRRSAPLALVATLFGVARGSETDDVVPQLADLLDAFDEAA